MIKGQGQTVGPLSLSAGKFLNLVLTDASSKQMTPIHVHVTWSRVKVRLLKIRKHGSKSVCPLESRRSLLKPLLILPSNQVDKTLTRI